MKTVCIAGIHIESDTFNPVPSGTDDFHTSRDAEMAERYPFLTEAPFHTWDCRFLAHFRALPGGVVARVAYEAMKAEILTRLDQVAAADGFLLDLHGAMAVEGLDDAELDLLLAIRERLGPALPISCCQDLHGNLSREFVAAVDAITCYRTAPHVDVVETRRRAAGHLARRMDGLPLWRAWCRVPVLLSGEWTSTLREPAASIYRGIPDLVSRHRADDASLWVGYVWADQPRAAAAVVALAEERDAAISAAAELAEAWWCARKEFRLVSPAGDALHCLREGLALGHPAVFLSDSGDNPTAGGAGDVTETLAALLDFPALRDGSASAIFASIPDPAAVTTASEAGPGAEIVISLGGKLDPVHGRPLTLRAEVERIVDSDPVAGRQVVLRQGGTRVIVTSRRKPFHRRADFLALRLDPLECTFTIVKIGYLEPELAAMARAHFLVLSAGAVCQDLARLSYRRLQRPLFPWDRDFSWRPEPACFAPGARA